MKYRYGCSVYRDLFCINSLDLFSLWLFTLMVALKGVEQNIRVIISSVGL